MGPHINHTLPGVLVILTLFGLLSCFEQEAQTAATEQSKVQFVGYSKDGIKLEHPSYWQLSFDDTPSLYGDRGIGFEVSESSMAYVYIIHQPNIQTSSLSDQFIQDLNLTAAEHIKNYRRETVDIAGRTGEKITFTDTFLAGETEVAITILNLSRSPRSVFAVFNLSDSDITNESGNIQHFTENFQLKDL